MRIEPRDKTTLEAIQRHGPLSSLYLWEFTKGICRNRFGFIKRLKALTDAGYLDRPPSLNHPRVWGDFKVYKLTDKGKRALGDLQHQYAKPQNNWDIHAFMTACITASIELAALDRGLLFLSQEAILARAPETTKAAEKPLLISSKISKTIQTGRTLNSEKGTEPDQLFGILSPDGTANFYALETDRGTEAQERATLRLISIERKMLSYNDIFTRGTFEKHLGIKFAYPLFITTSRSRAETLKKSSEKFSPKYTKKYRFGHVSGFDEYVKTPPVMKELFEVL